MSRHFRVRPRVGGDGHLGLMRWPKKGLAKVRYWH
jgi:hypothetical protein